MNFNNVLDWIQDFQDSTTGLSRWNPPMTKLEKQKCVKWVVSNIVNYKYNDQLNKIERVLDYWCRDKSDQQIEALVFRILDKYLIFFLNFQQ